MKLFTVQVAPNPTKVNLYIAEKQALGVSVEIEFTTVKLMKGEQHAADHVARNPFASLPVLEIADGSYIIESLPIIEYLEAILPGPSLWGLSPEDQAQARSLERIADARLLVPIAEYVHATSSPTGVPPNRAIADAARNRFPDALQYFDSLLADGRNWLNGKNVTIADCTLAAALQFARFGHCPIGGAYAQLNAWNDRYRERPAAQQTLLF